jgi:UDP-N-acetyl-2-amino-2-deoxyglucuronate dehydrogenase
MVDDSSSSISMPTAVASNSNELELGLAIVGCGQIVTHHLAAIASLQTFVVRALCDPSRERRRVIQDLLPPAATDAVAVPVAHFESLQDLIQDKSILDQIQVIFIAVPHDLHETLACQALGKTDCVVVLEKPLAPVRDACDRLVQASLQYSNKSSTGRLVIAEQSPYWQEVALARTMIQSGAIGPIVSAAAYYYESMRDNVTSGSVDSATGGLGWRGSIKRAGGGIAMDGGLHWIRPLREMCGRIDSVVGVIRTHLAPELQMEGESLGHALFKMTPPPPPTEQQQQSPLSPLSQPAGSGPLIATYSCHMLATAPMAHDTCPYFRITGTKGELVIHGDGLFKEQPGAGGMRLYDQENPTGKELFAPDRKGGFFLGFAGLWQHIYQIVVEQDAAAAHETVVRAADDVRVVLALYKSSETGQWETV